MHKRWGLFAVALAGCSAGPVTMDAASSDTAMRAETVTVDAVDTSVSVDANPPTEETSVIDVPALDTPVVMDSMPLDQVVPMDQNVAMDAPVLMDQGPRVDVQPPMDAPPMMDVVTRPDQSVVDVLPDVGSDVVSVPDVRPPDAGLAAPMCEPVRLTYYDVMGAGACEVMDAPTALSDGARAGLTLAIAEPWSGGMTSMDPMAACGECYEVTTADAQRILTVTDLCPIAGNPVCSGGMFHFDVARTAATQLGYIEEGIVEARARRVPCPVSGNIRAVVRDQNPTFLRLTLANTRLGIRAVSFRGAGAGVSATNPWTPMRRDGGAWAITGVGTLARGGTGVSLRIESGQGQVVESSAIIPSSARLRAVVDLGVQIDELAPQVAACVWRPPTNIYADGFGGIDRVRWAANAWAATTMIDAAYRTNCVSGSCLRFANVARFSGFALFYPQAFSRGSYTRVVFQARSNAARRVGVVLADGAMRCMETALNLTTTFQRFEVNIPTTCGAITTMRTMELRNDGADGAEIVLDDVTLQ